MGKFYEQFLKREKADGVIFDVDGTLLDSMPVWAHSGEHYLLTIGIHAPESLGRTLFSMTMEQGAEYIKQTFQLEQSAQEIQAGIIQVVAEAYRGEVGFKRAAFDFLRELRSAGVPMSVVTSNTRPLVVSAFQRLGIASYFDGILTCGEFGSGKDNPAIFHAAAKQMGSAVDGTWVVEDGLYALRTAKEAGYRTVGVADASSKEDEGQICGIVDYFIADYAQEI